MLGLIGFLLLILFRVTSRSPTVAVSKLSGVASGMGYAPNSQTRGVGAEVAKYKSKQAT
jgi:hypothetical protein